MTSQFVDWHDMSICWHDKLEQVRDIKFGMNISNEMLVNAANASVTALTVSELGKENHTQIRVNTFIRQSFRFQR